MQLKTILCLALLFLTCSCGRIYSGDLSVDYANAGKMTQLSFSFMLSNSINSDDYLKVALPFPFHSQLTPAVPAMQGLSSPSLLNITYQTIDPTTQATGTAYNTFVLTETIDSSNYYIRFYASDSLTLIPMTAGTWYMLNFKILDADALGYQMSSSILQIQLSTVSSVWSNSMVYDDNLAFQYFELAHSPSNLITLAVTPSGFTGNNGYLKTQASYTLLLDSTLNIPSYQFTQTLVLKFLMTDNRFLWNTASTCVSTAKTTSPTIAALDASLYTCVFDGTNNIVVVSLTPEALALQSIFRFSVGVINPAVVVSQAGIEARAMKTTESTILGYGLVGTALATNAIYVTYHEIFLGWGLRPDALLPFQANIYRGNSATPSYLPYNSLSVKFSISQSTSSNLQLKVVISIPSETSAFVLSNGFTHNLPAFPDKVVVCQTQYATSTTNRSIGCTGVGQLLTGNTYTIGWKMFFPYDNYQSDINCTQFGTIKVYSMQTITNTDNAFYMGRGYRFLDYLKTLPSVYVVGRNSSYITYMQTFFNLNLIVRSKDFQEFLQTPELVFINNRPKSYVNKIHGYEDLFVVNQNLAFLTYMGLFNDVYIAARLKSSSDIVKGYDSTPLVSASVPKNTLTITTVNSKDWTDYVSNQKPLVSSVVTGTQNNAASGGLLVDPSNQQLIFTMKTAYSDITNFSSTDSTNLTYSSGLMIIMNPLISNTSASITLKQQAANHASVSVKSYTILNASAYNNYSYVELSATLSNGLKTTFSTTATKRSFSVYPFNLNSYSSIYADSSVMDFYMAAVDGIYGPLNKMTYNSYFLINGFTQTSNSMATITMSYVNYLASSTSPLDGSTVPTLIRITGSIPVSNATNLVKIAVFFDDLTPFYANLYTQQVYCYGTDPAMSGLCDYFPGATSSSQKYNYNTLSRIQIPITNPSTTFTLYIPVVLKTSKVNAYTYFGCLYANPSNNNFPLLQYISTMNSNTYALDPSVASTGASFGLTVAGAAGAIAGNVTSLNLSARLSAVTVTNNTGVLQGSAFTFFSKWDLFRDTVMSGWPLAAECLKVTYIYYRTNYAAYLSTGATFTASYQNMTGIVCPVDTTFVSTAFLTLSKAYLPSDWGKVIPGTGAYSTNTGQIVAHASSYETMSSTPDISSSVTLPIVGGSMKNAITVWTILLPVQIQKSVLLRIKSSTAANLPYDANPSTQATCVIYKSASALGPQTKLPISCNIAQTYTEVNYTLTVKELLVNAGEYLSVYHFGMTTTANNNTIAVTFQCYSLATSSVVSEADIIFATSSALTFVWNNLVGANFIGPTSLSLSGFTSETINSGVISPFNLTFTLINKGLYNTERVRINLGQYTNDNSGSSLNPYCSVFTYSPTGAQVYSHDFGAIDYSQGYSKLQLWPKYHLFSNNLTYTIKCYNFITTSSPSPSNISAVIANTSSDMTGYAATAVNVSFPTMLAKPSTTQASVAKAFLTPSSMMEMSFTFTSLAIDTNTTLYLGFPSYYANGLGPDLKCYVGTTEIFCTVQDRILTIKYIGTYASGSPFTIVVVGVSQPINYNSGTFYYKMDSNSALNSVDVAGTFADTVSSTVLQIQNFPTIRISQFTQSSTFIRDTDVSVTFQFYLASSLKTITVGQQLIVNFPPIFHDVLRFISPTCTFTLTSNVLKNYVSSCSVRGLRIKMPLIDTLVLGSSYILTINGIINPTTMSPNYFKYYIEIADSSNSNIVLKSFSSLCNYIMPIFIEDPTKAYLNYYDVNDNKINTVYTYAGVQSPAAYISPGTPISSVSYNRNMVFTSSSSSVFTQPAALTFLSGSNPTGITFSSLSNGVQYIYLSKSGDGSYYSNLPPLTVITDQNYLTPISLVTTTFSIPADVVGTNYTIIISLPPALYPITSVNMSVTIPANGLSLQSNSTVITFYPGQPSAQILLYIDDVVKWQAGSTTTLTITPSTMFSGNINVTLTCVAAVSGAPTGTITPISNPLQKKYYTFNIQCSQFGNFFYHIERTFTYNSTACSLEVPEIRNYATASSTLGLRVTETYFDCQDQFGVINVPAINTNTLLTINNLKTTTAYRITGFCENPKAVDSTLISATFTTVSNIGTISEMLFNFNQALTVQQKVKLVCYLALKFSINYQKVSTYDGYYCSELLGRRRRRLQSYQVSVATDPKALYVYFGISTDLLIDQSYALISAASNSLSLVTNVNTEIVGMATLLSYGVSTAAFIGAGNDFIGDPYVDVGPNYVYIYGMKLPNNGLIYIIIGDSTAWPRDPIVSEIKVGSGPNGLAPQYSQVLAYRAADYMSGFFAYTNLRQGSFNMYIVASDANPFDTANFGAIKKYEIKNEVPSYGARAVAMLLAIIILVVM